MEDAMGAPVFICYGHADQAPIDWRDRLQLYLAQGRRSGGVDAWDDQRILAGQSWRDEIKQALERADAAILLVGPAFLRSSFIRSQELPHLLSARKERKQRTFPLIIGWCDYKGSALEPIETVNDCDAPLESLSLSDQNRILNQLSIDVSNAVDAKMRSGGTDTSQAAGAALNLIEPMTQLVREMEFADVAFRSQNKRCRELVNMVTSRLAIKEHLEFEKFLHRYHAQMNADELFEFQMVRSVTEGPLAGCNTKMLALLMDRPRLLDEVPSLTALRQHLVFWLNKYERVFRSTPAMAVCYIGVEDGVPWPKEAEAAVLAWVSERSGRMAP